jgi:hypothetical protein
MERNHMIELTYEQIISPVFNQGLARILHTAALPLPTAREIVQLTKSIIEERNTFQVLYRKLLDKHGIDPEKEPCFETKLDEENFKRERNELLSMKVSFDASKLQSASLNEIKLTPAELLAIEPVLEL